MQVLDEIEEGQTAQVMQSLAGVRIEVPPVLLAALETGDRQALTGGIHAQALQRTVGAFLQSRQQLAQGQWLLASGMALRDVGSRRVKGAHDLVFKRERCTAKTHDRQHGSSGDA